MDIQLTAYLERGLYDEAIALCEECINHNPTLTFSYWYLGLAWLLQGEESEAQAIWLSAIAQTSPDEMHARTLELLQVLETEAIRYLHRRIFPASELILWQIIEIDSHHPTAYYNLGHVLAQQGNYDAAIDCWQKAINLNPLWAEAYEDRGIVQQKLEEYDQAIASYLKALEIKPDNYQTAYNLGLCFSEIGQLEQAIAYFQTARQLQPNFTQASGDLGYAFLKTGQLDRAISSFHQAIPASFIYSYIHWIDTLVNLNQNINDNAKFLENLTSRNLAKILSRSEGFLEIAIDAYRKALSCQEDDYEAYLEMGKALAKKGDLDAAIAAYEKASNFYESHRELGKALGEKGDWELAIAAYQKALEINPDNPEIYFYLGNALLNNGHWDRALGCYQKKLEMQPDSVDAWWDSGIAFAQLNKPEAAFRCFQTSLQIYPELAQRTYDMLGYLCKEGKLKEEAIAFQQILPIEPPKEFYESAWDWAIISNLASSNYINIYPQNSINLTPPKTPETSIHFSFRFGSQVQLPASFVALVPDGRFWLNKNQDKSAIITSDNKILGDISPDFPVLSPGHPDKHPSKHSIFSVGKLPPIHRIDGTVAVLAGLLNDVYFHWMFDILPRIELLNKSGLNIAEIDKFLVSSSQAFQKETLEALGIPETKILETDNYHHLEAKTLIVPSFPGTIAWMPKWAVDFLRSVFLGEKSAKTERIYISRKETANRRIINEDEIINLLNQFGFKSVTLESMTVAEQAALLANAQVVIAPHGGGLTNTVFCNPGTKVIEIFAPNYVYPCYWLISNLVNLEYYYLLGENPEGFYLHKLLYPDARIEDIFVNPDELINILRFAQVI